MGFRIREALLGNWRNKGVALFFAVTIWAIAYQAETQSDSIQVRLVPVLQKEGFVIIRQEWIDLQGKPTPFDGTIFLTVSGPRRQVEKLRRDSTGQDVRFPVDVGTEPGTEGRRVGLTPAAFPFIPPAVKITGISPESILIAFDAAVEREFKVEPVYRRIPDGMEIEPAQIEPPTMKLRGPKTILDGMKVVVEPMLGAGERFEEKNLPVVLRYPESFDSILVDRTVRFVGQPLVKVTVRLRYKNESLDVEGIRVRFLVPPWKVPFRIQLAEETVRVRFQGPVGEIRRLRERVKEPDFVLAVRVDPTRLLSEGSAGERDRTGTFSEDDLLLYGFSDRIQILQHPQREAQGKGLWTYSIIPVPGAASTAGE
jgi:hypothetical protein